jgi:hypothetical protein
LATPGLAFTGAIQVASRTAAFRETALHRN